MTKQITHRDIIFRLLRLVKKLRETEQMKTKITLLLNYSKKRKRYSDNRRHN